MELVAPKSVKMVAVNEDSPVPHGGEGSGSMPPVIENDAGAAAPGRGVGNELLELAAPESVKMAAVKG